MVLFEVMMALFIFTMVAFGLVIALNSSLDAAMDRNAAELATRGLQNQLVLLHAARVQPGDNDLPDDGSGVLYHLTVDQEQMQDQKNQLVPNMYRAVLTAKWKSHGQVEARTVSELIYQQ
ncbi:MAG: hypothetical protein LV480_11215 [Methylacidiphilales bacterium]|nr:hypothetical protein [Candidatus Methylacidiphilales bacterium]